MLIRCAYLCLMLLLSTAVCSTGLPDEKKPRCVDGLWFFDKSDSDNLPKLKATWLKLSGSHVDEKNTDLPFFVFSMDDATIERQADAVAITLNNQSARVFSTVGRSRSVSLKKMTRAANTVVASWEGERLVIESTTSSGLYIEEKFSLQHHAAPQTLRIETRLKNRLGQAMIFEKFYHHRLKDWQACGQAVR